ncbi:hypothetical protein F53441_2891 [Fusarium austroafricanum]|uniref:Uncharacterized protein n=1 Tax=Fusarium austroafricanum TaxID=2364996 RepID=A0A8H4KNZ7_9HYPO|nr:hypothetical protein F53441_2891 [Fusarium austroafricanum]
MNSNSTAVDPKTTALWDCMTQWHAEVSAIKSPELVFQESYALIRHRFDNELEQLMHQQNDPNEYNRHREAILQKAGDMKELEIHYKLSTASMQQAYQERMELAHKRLACSLIEALGETINDPWIQNKFQQALAQQTSVAIGADAIEQRGDTAEEPNADSNENQDHEANRRIIRADLILGQVTSLCSIPGNASSEDQNQQKDTPATEVEVHNPSQIQEQSGNLPQSTSSDFGEPLSKSAELGQMANPTTENPSQGSNPATEMGQPSETNVQETRANEQPILDPGGSNPRNIDSQILADGDRADNAHDNREGNQNNTMPTATSNSNLPLADVHLHHSTKRPQPITMSETQQKRPRRSSPSTEGERVIYFDQVYQNGNAQVKYIIVKFPHYCGKWYILECKEHQKHFVKSPLRAASSHLSFIHGMSGGFSSTVETLGTRVLNCTEELAEENNRVARQAFTQGRGMPPMLDDADKGSQMHSENSGQSDVPSHDQGEKSQPQEDTGTPSPEISIIPVVGEVYAARYPKSRYIYPVFVLPWTSFDHFKWKAALLKLTPVCYLYNKKLDQRPQGWAEGYEDGGPLVNERQYPVIYFDGKPFPDQCDVGWVPISDMKAFNPDNPNIVHRTSVAEFLSKKDPRLTIMTTKHCTRPENYIVISDESDCEDQNTGSSRQKPLRVADKPTQENSDEMAVEGHNKNLTRPDNPCDDSTNKEVKETSSTERGNCNNGPGVENLPTFQRSINQDSETITRSQSNNCTPRVPSVPSELLLYDQPTLMKRRIEAPFVIADTESRRPTVPETHSPPVNSLLQYHITGAVEQGGEGPTQLIQSVTQGSNLQNQLPPILPTLSYSENLQALAAEARAALFAT